MFNTGVKKIHRVTIETVMQSPKVPVYCLMSECHTTDPYFCCINEQNPHAMLEEFFIAELQRLRKASSAIFGEDGAPAHCSRDVVQYFDKVIPNRWIGRGSAHKMNATFLLTCLH